MDSIDIIILLFLVVLAFMSYRARKKIVFSLHKYERDFCSSIGLTNNMATDSPLTSFKMAALVAFGVNESAISNETVLELIYKARPIDIIYYVTFLFYLIYLFWTFST